MACRSPRGQWVKVLRPSEAEWCRGSCSTLLQPKVCLHAETNQYRCLWCVNLDWNPEVDFSDISNIHFVVQEWWQGPWSTLLQMILSYCLATPSNYVKCYWIMVHRNHSNKYKWRVNQHTNISFSEMAWEMWPAFRPVSCFSLKILA